MKHVHLVCVCGGAMMADGVAKDWKRRKLRPLKTTFIQAINEDV